METKLGFCGDRVRGWIPLGEGPTNVGRRHLSHLLLPCYFGIFELILLRHWEDTRTWNGGL